MVDEELLAAIGQMLDEKLGSVEYSLRCDFTAALEKTERDLRTDMATKNDLNRFATKDDLNRFATKDDLNRFATKDDLNRFATKDDLNRFATKDDLNRFATKDDLEKLERELRVLIENGSERVAKLLQEDYGRVSAAAQKGALASEELAALKSTVATHAHALQSHGERLSQLEAKAI